MAPTAKWIRPAGLTKAGAMPTSYLNERPCLIQANGRCSSCRDLKSFVSRFESEFAESKPCGARSRRPFHTFGHGGRAVEMCANSRRLLPPSAREVRRFAAGDRRSEGEPSVLLVGVGKIEVRRGRAGARLGSRPFQNLGALKSMMR